ncbi:hypothetical protein FB459_1064 [Yimella lutea]|uniref:Very-short-patch-repair endonuclease n=1 Tax=Yimella lutea TaxID=587872 RepID=A0A542EE69_9MICO|nr:type IV toxin-antitoxin system AbiEi family antitoxin domain-containing protein [Yimella lutea]TQJ13638.1 hypothetical protein FB459_1064 [Yimella lutea]
MDVVSWEEVQSRGLGARDVRRLVATGEWTRLRRGWFATRAAADDEDAHRLRAIAYKREYAGRAVISHVSALVHWELPTIDRDLSVVHLSRTVAGKSRRLGDLHLHVALARELQPRDGVEHPAIAALQVAQTDLPAALAAADAAWRRGLLRPDDLELCAPAFLRRKGRVATAQVVEQIDRRHESPGETLTALQLRLAGVAYEPQFDVPDSGQWTPAGRGYRADFRVIGHNVLIEFDGKVKYENGDSVFQEKKREDHLRSLGWIVVRVVWSDLKIPGRVATLVREAVARAS